MKTATLGVLFAKGGDVLDKEVLDHVRSRKKEIQDVTNRITQSLQVCDIQVKFIITKLVAR